MSEYILELKNVVKRFGGVVALDHVHFSLRPGEIHALMGENGAGKSTLVKIITGAYHPDEGEMFFEGKPVHIKETRESQKLGIGAIYQHDTSFGALTVTENIFMERPIVNKLGMLDWKAMHKRAREILAPFTDTIDVKKTMDTLSVAQQQIVAISKAISHDAKVLIMDEPTSALTNSECEQLYQIAESLRDKGIAIILITHKFEDMYRLASQVTVFRDSKYIGSWGINEISEENLIEAMVGRKLTQMYPTKTAVIQDDVVLEVKDLCSVGYFHDVSFKVCKGEILALTGLVGAGRTEVSQGIYGILPITSGKIYVDGKETRIRNSSDAIRAGIGLVPENRQEHGLFNRLPIFMNITSAALKKFTTHGAMNRNKEKAAASETSQRLLLKARDILAFPTTLSGGNQQKVVLAKMLCCDLKVLILDEPTKGIDIGAKYSLYEIMNELAAQGYAIIMISSEMPEVLGMADRVVVMKSGTITGEFDDMATVTSEQILAASVLSGLKKKKADTEEKEAEESEVSGQ